MQYLICALRTEKPLSSDVCSRRSVSQQILWLPTLTRTSALAYTFPLAVVNL